VIDAVRRLAETIAGIFRAQQPPADPRGPILFVDCYWGDHGPLPNFAAVAAEPGYYGAVIKATQGRGYRHADWFVNNWKRVAAAGAGRFGRSWFRGCYHYLVIKGDPIAQADYYLSVVERAGGWAPGGDILPIVDVEEGQENAGCSRQQVVDCTTRFVERIRQRLGVGTILYAGSYLRELGITDRMGCVGLWTARYGPALGDKAANIGWSIEDVFAWQYAGDHPSNLPKGLPWGIKGFGNGDTNVVLNGKLPSSLAVLRDRWVMPK